MKTSDPATGQGFESLPLRQTITTYPAAQGKKGTVMNDFEIVTDGSADVDAEILSEKGVTVVPFYVMLGSGEYKRQNYEVTTAEFYNWMISNPGLFPKSSAPSAEDYFEVFRPMAEAGRKIICICITVKFSSSYQSALIARQMVLDELPDASIEVIDATVNTVLQGQLVLEACALRDAGTSFDNAVNTINSLKSTGRIFFTIGSMDYLRMGGRIGQLAGKISSMLGIRPIITLSEGEIHASGMVRGRQKSIEKVKNLAKNYLIENFSSPEDLSITVGYGYGYDEAFALRNDMLEMLDSLGLKRNIPIERISSVIGVHTGPYPLGVGILKRAIKA